MDKGEILSRLKSSERLPYEFLEECLSSQGRDIKHEAWNYVLRSIRLMDKEFIYSLLSFKDTGTRYRAWNEVANFVKEGILSLDEVIKFKEYFKEMLKDSNLTVRSLVWYVTLKPLIEMGVIEKDEIYKYSKYLCELLSSQFSEVANEVKQEFEINCNI
ncbi:hypothetical protein [Saccharolobus islandicus]|uniref:Uncharacterized protein n=1 Tax=Saccharolobus islandicus LAL14/1 TaxID=1241935 RepID=M9UBT0_SACIS|nr:hypothetical protein [Sulfolobus islandicus]AGJ61956.1 Hypothetical Protein SiL_0485 [Sulfolobus islandicus LAL14/1]